MHSFVVASPNDRGEMLPEKHTSYLSRHPQIGLQGAQLKTKPTTITCYDKKNHKHVHSSATLSQPPRDTQINVTFVARPLLALAVQKLRRCEHGVFTSKICVHSQK
jgi:hypothetical protein